MLSLHGRATIAKVLDPLGVQLAKTRLTPNAVTVTGTIGSCLAAIFLLATGHFIIGPLVTTVFIATDLLDGLLARSRGGGTVYGAFLDSSMDRIADATAFGALTYWFATGGYSKVMVAVGLVCIGAGQVTSYVKARAESVGLSANVGIAERAERLIVPGVFFLLQGITGVHWLGALSLWIVAVASIVTVGQRLVEVRRQAERAEAADRVPAASGSAPASAS
jgi:CDP-diacylglycerol--glycerol-3-phosphate 3-phosphatidyltransferase